MLNQRDPNTTPHRQPDPQSSPEPLVAWRRVNDEPFEYAIQQGSNGDEFVKLIDGSSLRRPLSASPEPEGVREALDVEAMAQAMQQANALSMLRRAPWETIDDNERNHWRFLAEAAGLKARTALSMSKAPQAGLPDEADAHAVRSMRSPQEPSSRAEPVAWPQWAMDKLRAPATNWLPGVGDVWSVSFNTAERDAILASLSASPLSPREEVVEALVTTLTLAKQAVHAKGTLTQDEVNYVTEEIAAAIRALAQPAVGRDGTTTSEVAERIISK